METFCLIFSERLTLISQCFPTHLWDLKMQAVTGMGVRDMSNHAFYYGCGASVKQNNLFIIELTSALTNKEWYGAVLLMQCHFSSLRLKSRKPRIWKGSKYLAFLWAVTINSRQSLYFPRVWSELTNAAVTKEERFSDIIKLPVRSALVNWCYFRRIKILCLFSDSRD